MGVCHSTEYHYFASHCSEYSPIAPRSTKPLLLFIILNLHILHLIIRNLAIALHSTEPHPKAPNFTEPPLIAPHFTEPPYCTSFY